jgi:thioredoxin-like negative regulator of GroEL
MSSSKLLNVTSLAQLKALPQYSSGVVVIDFFAPWSDISKELDVVAETLAAQHSGITFVKVRPISDKFDALDY